MENLERDLASQRVPRSVYCPWLSRQVTGAQGPVARAHINLTAPRLRS